MKNSLPFFLTTVFLFGCGAEESAPVGSDQVPLNRMNKDVSAQSGFSLDGPLVDEEGNENDDLMTDSDIALVESDDIVVPVALVGGHMMYNAAATSQMLSPTYYHVTSIEKLASIREFGLIPANKLKPSSGLIYHGGAGGHGQYVWLSKTPIQLPDKVILEIKPSGLNINPDLDRPGIYSSRDVIPPRNIHIAGTIDADGNMKLKKPHCLSLSSGVKCGIFTAIFSNSDVQDVMENSLDNRVGEFVVGGLNASEYVFNIPGKVVENTRLNTAIFEVIATPEEIALMNARYGLSCENVGTYTAAQEMFLNFCSWRIENGNLEFGHFETNAKKALLEDPEGSKAYMDTLLPPYHDLNIGGYDLILDQ